MLDFNQIRTYPIRERKNKFSLDQMIPLDCSAAMESPEIRTVAQRIVEARRNGAPVIAMLGGAVIKEGCGLLLCDLMRRGFIQHIGGNGSVSIHDFEIAMIGETSEDVANGLQDGMFGMAEETGRLMNEALIVGAAEGKGYGQSIGEQIGRQEFPHRDCSVLFNALQLGVPATLHVAVGGDIIHQHPACDGAALGATTFMDFRILTETVAGLAGGVVLNIGSAVIMPEAFLKALTIARNLGHDVAGFMTVNFDFINMYRPRTRIVEWPKTLGCDGLDIRGGHRETLPTLYREILNLV